MEDAVATAAWLSTSSLNLLAEAKKAIILHFT
jgi:hypothetical protein